ncbi:unnamed protein product [Anisakis simplex]|uniref:Flagellar protein FlgN n=1 Tax=Anisakis simplex TaxID=6269 RepID=A0A0M3JFX6_ANISI|nr:unnamed protein product [Anisakis simplex]
MQQSLTLIFTLLFPLLLHAATENEKLAYDLLVSKDKLLAEAHQLEELAILLLQQNVKQTQMEALKASLTGLPIGTYNTISRTNAYPYRSRPLLKRPQNQEVSDDDEQRRLQEILKRFLKNHYCSCALMNAQKCGARLMQSNLFRSNNRVRMNSLDSVA